MKKTCALIIILISLICVNTFGTTDLSEIKILLRNGLVENYDQINNLASKLDDNQLSYLYSKYQKDFMVSLGINWFVGFGIGSFVEGDVSGGAFALIGELGGLGMTLSGAILGSQNIMKYGDPDVLDTGLIVGGVAIWLVAKIYEIIRPIVFSNNYNNTLHAALYKN